MNKITKIGTLLLTGNIALFTLTGCYGDPSKEVITATKINTGARNIIDYDTSDIKYDEYLEKTFEIGQHVIGIKLACSFEYNKNFAFNAPNGYEILTINYGENVDGETDDTYGYAFVTFVNIVPVKVKGYYNEETNTYQFTDFGGVIEKDKQKTLTD